MSNEIKTTKYYIVNKSGRSLLCPNVPSHAKLIEDLMVKKDGYFTSKNGYFFGKPKILKVVTSEVSDIRELIEFMSQS